MMKWVLIGIFVFSAAVGAGLYFFKGSGFSSNAKEVDWRLLSQMDYIENTASEELKKVDKTFVKVPGFMVPLEDNQQQVTEFLLVPSPQACIHVPPPPPNQMVYVKMAKGTESKVGAPIWVYGEFKISTKRSQYGEVSFEVTAEEVEDYK